MRVSRRDLVQEVSDPLWSFGQLDLQMGAQLIEEGQFRVLQHVVQSHLRFVQSGYLLRATSARPPLSSSILLYSMVRESGHFITASMKRLGGR